MSAGGRRWGWHQLESSWADHLVANANLRPGDLVLDVGAGYGMVTAALVNAGVRVVAVELHPGRAASLRRRFRGSDVTVVQADAAELRLPLRPYRVVANPPYAITSPLLRRLLQPGSRLVTADLVLQRQAARRWASANAPGLLAMVPELPDGVGAADPSLGVPSLRRRRPCRSPDQAPRRPPWFGVATGAVR